MNRANNLVEAIDVRVYYGTKRRPLRAVDGVSFAVEAGETLAKLGGLNVFSCPIPIPTFTVKQHWHSRYHNDPGNRWLRELCASLFLRDRSGE